MGRPTKLTPEVQTKLCQAIAAGNYYQAACAYAGISYDTFNEWMRRQGAPYSEFCQAVHKAEAEAEVRVVAQWQQHMPTDYKACRDFLARRHPERWGPKKEVKLSGLDAVLAELPGGLGLAVRRALVTALPGGNGETPA